MKNYKKIYNKLIKEIKNELQTHQTITGNSLQEQIENEYGITILNWILSILPEIEGKKCCNIIMNQKEFKNWKKKLVK
jgi:hypothetical protein